MDSKAPISKSGSSQSAHIDRFVLDNLPPTDLWPDFNLGLMPDGVSYPERLNCADFLLKNNIERGFTDKPAFHFDNGVWSYGALNDRVDAIAKYLVEDLALIPGNRILLRGANTPMLAACWLAIVKAGGICVTTMPLLRAVELGKIITHCQPRFALCDIEVKDELERALKDNGLENIGLFTALGDSTHAKLDQAMAAKSGPFEAVDTAATDPAIAAFTSGTTGEPKCAIHSHRDLMAATDCFPRTIWDIQRTHVFSGSPPIAFTFGCGAFILIPMRFGASIALVASPSPENLLSAIERHKVTDLYTAPTMYRRMTALIEDYDISSLKHCNSAGEHLPLDTFNRWKEATGLKIIDALGSTEMFHNFMATPPDRLKPGSTGFPVQGYQAKLIGNDGGPLPPGEIGRLAVRGANGCLYLGNDEAQKKYVQDGWNITGDLMSQDEQGYFYYAGRSDDLIISSGYNISGIEIEHILLQHESVTECAVIGVPDPERGSIVKAFIVAKDDTNDQTALAKQLQDYVKAELAPYKYPRAIAFLDALPRTPTGKVQRFKLRELEMTT